MNNRLLTGLRSLALFFVFMIFLAATAIGQNAVSTFGGDPERWAEALAEARSVQRVLAYVIVGLSGAVVTIVGFIFKAGLAQNNQMIGVMREVSAGMKGCEQAREEMKRHNFTGGGQ